MTIHEENVRYLTDWLTDKINSNLRTCLFLGVISDLCTSSSEKLFRETENPVALPGEINRSYTVIS